MKEHKTKTDILENVSSKLNHTMRAISKLFGEGMDGWKLFILFPISQENSKSSHGNFPSFVFLFFFFGNENFKRTKIYKSINIL